MKTTRPTKDYSEISFNYICDECGANHLAYLREVKIEGFRIVCYCDNIIYPEIVSDIKIIYKKSTEAQTEKNDLSSEIIEQCIKTMLPLGYDPVEAQNMICQAFAEINSDDCSELIKYSLKNFGVNYA
tara:strand:- start:149 stop:532 length:384 start_codon:yes stop_codon:yes gene_type:complete